jgi:hypothetical protein
MTGRNAPGLHLELVTMIKEIPPTPIGKLTTRSVEAKGAA